MFSYNISGPGKTRIINKKKVDGIIGHVYRK
jgi:hypothetical protein